jgi:hypothetical protein
MFHSSVQLHSVCTRAEVIDLAQGFRGLRLMAQFGQGGERLQSGEFRSRQEQIA